MRPTKFTAVLGSGWFRLWVVSVRILLGALVAGVAYSLWGREVCYRFVTVSAIESPSVENAALVAQMQKEAETRTYCKDTPYSTLLTLEQLAKNGTVTQVGLQWQEPRGWSFSDFEFLDVLDPKEIRTSEILSRAHHYVGEARLRSFGPLLVALSGISMAALLVGVGIAWVRRGFASKGKSMRQINLTLIFGGGYRTYIYSPGH